jgi:hypothetical protein
MSHRPNNTVSPAASATATTQPHQAGTRQIPQDLPAMFSRIVTALRDATAESINPRISASVASQLSSRSLSLQQDLAQISARLDSSNGSDHLAIYQDLNTVGGDVQGFIQAVINALDGVGEGLQTTGGPALGRLGAALTDAEKAKQTWIYFGVGAAVVLAGLGLFLVTKHKPARVGKITGAMSAR